MQSPSAPEHNSATDVLQALGALVVNVAVVEESLHDAIFLLAGGENQAVGILTAGLPFRTLVEKFGSLCTQLPEPRLSQEDVTGFCSRLNTLNDERNTFIHSGWNLRSAKEGHRRFKRSAKAKTGFKLNPTAVSAAQVRELSARLIAAEKKIWEFVP